ncbi:hypothetical protein DND132_2397 [Pseudodesulfovibrio mercurii]|uniref:Prenylated flavin chaperone LpdD-like domain-containing protein n=1 Tax=Pseudodesulfovibrio mercurii TaxID=641491 RepID=F0JC27_9BACT|nr:hypothetical protein [Pseudodesulfovibrio mercurii]EGB15600.1 hypothetical protein DND132_2397 [Pseudodesulfovibrio mercurii]
MISLERGNGRFLLRMTIVRMGNDYCVALHGGDRSHIGAVALAVPGGLGSADIRVSVLPLPGHQERELAVDTARCLAGVWGGTVAVSCGIHLDDATPEEIAYVLAVADELVRDAMQRCGKEACPCVSS